MSYRIFVFLLCVYLESAASSGCVSRRFDQDSFVCVCNSTYCDSLETPSPTQKGNFLLYSSTKDGLRFQASTGAFSKVPAEEENFGYDDGTSVTLQVNLTDTYQTIMGFGGAFTDAAGINFKSLSPQTADVLLRSYFDESGIGYTIGRVPIGGTDFSPRIYTYDDIEGEDLTLQHFALQSEDLDYKIPYIQRARVLSKQPIRLFASPWSAPAWMKNNHDITGMGWLKSEYYQVWADYFLKFLEGYKQHGIDFWAVTTQNEPADGLIPFFSFNCMGWLPSWMAKWIKNNLGPTLANSTFSDVNVITMDDDRVFLSYWAIKTLGDPDVAKYVSGMGVHWYLNKISSPNVLTTTHNKYPKKFILATEACNGDNMSGYKGIHLGWWGGAERFAKDILDNLNNWVTGWVEWNLALDTKGGPCWDNSGVDASIIVDAAKDEFYKQPSFYAMGHFAKFLPVGSQRVGLEGDTGSLMAVAVKRPDGGVAVVLLNRSSKNISVGITDPERGTAHFQAPTRSIQTLLYW